METHTQDCNQCRKNDVCKYKLTKQSAEAKIETEMAEEVDYNFLTVSLLCHYYDVKATTTIR